MNNTFYTNKEYFLKTLENIKKDWAEKLHILADFDGTMTKVFFEWKKRVSLVSLLRWEEWVLWEECSKQDSILFEKYHPIEIDPNLSMTEKKEKMIEWWTGSFNLFIKYWLNINTLKELWKTTKVELRKWIKLLLEYTNSENIPFVIISASWIWKKSIEYFLKERGLFFSNVFIISNDFEWDKDWYATKFKTPIIHTFSKSEVVLEKFSEIQTKIKDRKNVILLWDSLWDHHMVDLFEYKNLIKIWFLNDKKEELLRSYKDRYDIVLTWDWDFDEINKILENMIKLN